MTDLDAALAQAKRPERTVTLVLRGDLTAAFEDLERELHAEQQKPADSLAGNPRVQEIAEQMESLREQMTSSTVVLRLRGLSNPEWNRLVTEHEPREGNTGDKAYGYNTDAFFPALVRACLLDVSDAQWANLYEVASSGQFSDLSDAAVAVSRRRVDPPRSFAASEVLKGAAAPPPLPDG